MIHRCGKVISVTIVVPSSSFCVAGDSLFWRAHEGVKVLLRVQSCQYNMASDGILALSILGPCVPLKRANVSQDVH